MNSEELSLKIAKLLKIPDEKKNLVFSIFKEKLLEFLNIGEAIKIDKLGVFQLKEQLRHSGSSKILDPEMKDLTLVFSPTEEGNSKDSLFINLEIEDQGKDEIEFDENVFQLGIGKPLVIDNVEDPGKTAEEDEQGSIDKKVSLLLNDSEKIKDFDLWEDHLKSKETRSLMDEKIEDSLETFEDDKEGEIFQTDEKEIEEDAKDILDEEFEQMDEEELIEDYMKDNDVVSEERDNKAEEFEIDRSDSSDIVEDLIEEDSKDGVFIENDEKIEKTPDFEDEKIKDKKEDQGNIELDEIDLELDSSEKKEEEFIYEDDAEEELKIGTDGGDKDSMESIDDEEDEIEINEKFLDEQEKLENMEETGSLEDIDNDNKDEDILESKPELIDPEEKTSATGKTKSSSSKGLIVILVSAFVIIAAVASYYLFLNDSASLDDSFTTTEVDESVPDIPDESSEQGEDAKNEIPDENSGQPTSDAENTVSGSNIDPQNRAENVVLADNRKIEENEVAQNIFYDGNSYNIQVSSWKQKSIADGEVQKLLNMGYPAFILKVYIPKFDGTWHRVRVGPYNSLNEAKTVQEKLN